MSENIG